MQLEVVQEVLQQEEEVNEKPEKHDELKNAKIIKPNTKASIKKENHKNIENLDANLFVINSNQSIL